MKLAKNDYDKLIKELELAMPENKENSDLKERYKKLQDKCERLDAKCDELRQKNDELINYYDSARRRALDAERALSPFADYAAQTQDFDEDDDLVYPLLKAPGFSITIGKCRNALEVLEEADKRDAELPL